MIGQLLSKLKRRDALLWSTDVGRMHWRNNIIVSEHRAFLSTSGEQWNKPDQRDGVHCLDLDLGTKLWFCATHFDANEIALIGNVLLVGTDQGKAIAINADNGAILQEISVAAPIYTRAVNLESGGARIAILISLAGEIIQYDLAKNNFTVLGTIPQRIRANPVAVSPTSLLVGSESGAVLLVHIKEENLSWDVVFQIHPHRASAPHTFDLEIKGISNIAVVGDRVILAYVRDTYDRRPPLTCFSLKTGQMIWDATRVQSASKTERQEFGNSRVMPAIWKNLVISTFSYNESVHAFSLETGKWLWRERLDDSYFQNWSSPVVSEDRLYVARINGVLSVVDLNARRLISSYSVEVFNVPGDPELSSRTATHREREAWPNANNGLETTGPDPSQPLVAGICSTPVVLKDKVLVGTVSGRLCCLRRES